MERVEQFQIIKGYHCTLFIIQRSLIFVLSYHTTFHNVMMRIGDVVLKIA